MHSTRFAVTNAAAVPIEVTDNDGGKLYIYNSGASDVYVGGSDVDAAGTKGLPVKATTYLPFAIEYGPGEGPLYCIASAAGPFNVYALQTGEHA